MLDKSKKKIAIIGAGIAGLVLAHQLREFAHIELIEKSSGFGGRLSTRDAAPFQFDHGAQFFTAKTEPFQTWLKPLVQEGIIDHWNAEFVEMESNTIIRTKKWDSAYPHFVATPKMNQIGKYLAQDLNIKKQTRIEAINGRDHNWVLCDEKGQHHGPYEWVISTAPAAQTVKLLPKEFSGISQIHKTKMTGCFALMLGFNEPIGIEWQAALVKQSDISWISVNSSKPGRPKAFSVVVLSTNAWAELHMEDDIGQVKENLLREASFVTGHNLAVASHIAIHRWRYANISKQPKELVMIDSMKGLAACGDWCIEGIVEAAFTSAMKMANEIKKLL